MVELAQAVGLTKDALSKWVARRERPAGEAGRRGRPTEMSEATRQAVRQCYLDHYCQWGPQVLSNWAQREGLGSWCAATMDKVIADLKPAPEPQAKPVRFEIIGPGVMWSEDGAGFKEWGCKRELLIAQDEYSRYKVNHRLADGPASEADVLAYLTESFERHGAPLVLKHDGGKIFHSDKVRNLLDEWGVTDLTGPRYWPRYNGRMERCVRDIKSYERAMRKHGVRGALADRLEVTLNDLNYERPRPVLKGRTAYEAFAEDQILLPDRGEFRLEVERKHEELLADATSRHQEECAGRKAVEHVLLTYGLLEIVGDLSTDFQAENQTD